jgi:hypothetical protein
MRPTYGVAPVDPSLSPKPFATHEEEGGYFYAGDYWEEGSIGMQFGGQVSQPTVSTFTEAHSIDQLAEESDGEAIDTMEEGWIVSRRTPRTSSPMSTRTITRATANPAVTVTTANSYRARKLDSHRGRH